MTIQKYIYEISDSNTKLEFSRKIKKSIGYVCNVLNSEEDILMHTVKKWVNLLGFDDNLKAKVYVKMIENLEIDKEIFIKELKKPL